MRDKEDATDYRYFPNGEIMPVFIGQEWIEAVRSSLPESADKKYRRMTEEMALSEYDSRMITGSKALSDIFDGVLKYFDKPKEIVNWIIGDLLSMAKGDNKGEDDIVIDCEKFAKLIRLVDDKVINRATGKKLLTQVLEENADPELLVLEQGLAMISDTSELETFISEVLAENEKSVAEYKGGSEKVFGFLVGQVMRKSSGKADPKVVNELLMAALEQS
jgi:aspartyl-tRNA(Asn)/glutamyl-tRNA(Gln) amidotransferase subunit B